MLKAKKIFFSFLFFSLGLHLFFLFQVTFKIDQKQSPRIYAWPSILSKADLSSHPKEVRLPQGLSFSSNQIRKAYFSKPAPLSTPGYIREIAGYPKLHPKIEKESRDSFFFLWKEKPASFSSQKPASYQALVSPQGKIILLYPKKLSFNSSNNIAEQSYLKESAYFFKKGFSWTKFEVIVK